MDPRLKKLLHEIDPNWSGKAPDLAQPLKVFTQEQMDLLRLLREMRNDRGKENRCEVSAPTDVSLDEFLIRQLGMMARFKGVDLEFLVSHYLVQSLEDDLNQLP